MMTNLLASATSMIESIIPFLVVLTVLVFFHELGHYLVARWNGVKVDVFSIGFGPEIFGWTDKSQTRWKFSLLPFGGYVKMYGDVDPSGQAVNPELSTMAETDRQMTLMAKTPLQRIAVSAAGPIANYILAVVLLMGLFIIKGVPTMTNEVGQVLENGVAARLGIQKEDRIIRINDHQVSEFKDLPKALEGLAGKNIDVEVLRPVKGDGAKDEGHEASSKIIFHGKMVDITAAHPEGVPVEKIGIAPGGSEFKPAGIVESITSSFVTCYNVSVGMLEGIWKILTGRASGDQMGGFLSIGHGAKEFANKGMADLILFMAFISVNLGLINLFPVPVVDGGNIVLCAIEAVRGKPISDSLQEKIFGVGLLLVLSLMIYTTWNDLMRFHVVDWFLGLFGK